MILIWFFLLLRSKQYTDGRDNRSDTSSSADGFILKDDLGKK